MMSMLMMKSRFEQRIAVVLENVLKQNLMMMCKRKVELELKLKEDIIKADVDRSAN